MTTQANVVCDPDSQNNTHHIKLSDGTNQLGFILRSGNRVDPRAINRRPRQNGQYSPFTQSDWGGGRGIKDAPSDRSRYADGKRVITRHRGSVMIAGQETYSTFSASGVRYANQYMPGVLGSGNVTWRSLLTTTRYIDFATTPPVGRGGNRDAIYLFVRRRGTPTSTLTVELCADSAGNPGTVLKTVTKTTADITDTVSQLLEFAFSSTQAVTELVTYHVKVYAAGGADSAANCWQVGTDDSANSSLSSSDGSTWGSAGFTLYFRLVDDTDCLGALFFQYKQQLYLVTRPAASATASLYINGDRGIATGTGAGWQSTTNLTDTTKTWETNEWVGCILYIISGANSEFSTPYRRIASNNASTITVDPPWPRANVAADTTYVILGSNKWTLISGHGLTLGILPTSVSSAGEICYFAQGDSTKIRRMREYVNNAVWTREFAEDDNYAKFLIDWRHPTSGFVVGKVNDSDGSGLPSWGQANPEPWGSRLKFPMLIDRCEATTLWTAGAGAAIALDNTDFREGSNSIKITVSSGPANPTAYVAMGFTTSGSYRIPRLLSLAGQRNLRFWFKSSIALAAGDVKIFPSISATAASTVQDVNLPAIPANEWVHLVLPINDSLAGMASIQSIGFRTTAAAAVYNVDALEIFPSGSSTPLGNKGEKITGVNTYGDPEVPWIFRTRSAGSIENGVFNPIPLRELSTADNIHNGMGNVVHNVYLYFSFLHGLERFYRNNLDDVGPNRDEGLPDGRRGFITAMAGYVGRFFYNYDCPDGRSAIFESTSGTDHHEIYRSDTPGKRIRNLFVQVVPGDTADRLWFTEGDDVAWLPLPGNTLKEDTDDTFKHSHEGVLETGWITGAEQDAVKLFHSLKLFLENVTANRNIEWDYKKDEDTAWTPVSTSFTSPPVQEISLQVAAKRIKFRFRLQTNVNTETPMIRGMVLHATTRPETRYTYTMRTVFADDPIDLQGQQDTSLTADAVITQLDAWMAANTPLTLSSIFKPLNGKTVFLEPVVLNPLTFIPDSSKEKLEGSLTLTEP